MAELKKEQIAAAVNAAKAKAVYQAEKRAAARLYPFPHTSEEINLVWERILIAAAPYLQLPWGMTHKLEVQQFESIRHIATTEEALNDLICSRNAALPLKPVDKCE